MKKIVSMIAMLAVLFGSLSAFPVHAGIIGEVITTDIVTFLDEQPIESYNIRDYTYVIAEDLRYYGFAVRWDAGARTLDIYRQINQMQKYPPAELINVRKDAVIKGQHAFDVYETDIVTRLDGVPVHAYNVDGQTLIQVDELSACGYFSYNDARREVKVNLAAFYTDWLYSLSDKEALELPCAYDEGTITYSGSIADGKPQGFGRVTEEYEFTNGLQYSEKRVTTTKYVDEKPYDVLYSYGVKIPHNGSDRRKQEYYTFEKYAEGGILQDMAYSVRHYDDGETARKESMYTKGQEIFRRETEYDPAYRFGYRVVKEGAVDATGQFIDYHETEAGQIVSVHADGSRSYVTDNKGSLFVMGNSVHGKRLVPIKIGENAQSAAGSYMLDRDGVLYQIPQANEAMQEIARGVRTISDEMYLTEAGELYTISGRLIAKDVASFSSQGRLVLFQKADGSAYYARLNFEEEGAKWMDGLDLSAPVKVFDRAKSVNCGNRFLVVDENNTLWGWSSQWYGTQYQGQDGNLFATIKPIVLAKDVAFADSGTGFIAYVTCGGELYVMPDKTEPDNAAIFDITEPTKLLDHVVSISAGGGYMHILDDTGSLYAWGKNQDGRLGTGRTTDETVPVPIFSFYERNE